MRIKKKKTMWVSDRHEGPQRYMADVMRMSEGLPMDGIYSMEVLHDDWCALLVKDGECNCNPDVQSGKKLA